MTQERQVAVDIFHRQKVREAELLLARATERLLLAKQELQRGDDPLEALLIAHYSEWKS